MINKFHNILQNALDLRKEYVEKNNLEAYRLYDRENNKLSEVAVDVFKDWCVVQVYGKMPEKKLSQVIEALDKLADKSPEELVTDRREKFNKMGYWQE